MTKMVPFFFSSSITTRRCRHAIKCLVCFSFFFRSIWKSLSALVRKCESNCFFFSCSARPFGPIETNVRNNVTTTRSVIERTHRPKESVSKPVSNCNADGQRRKVNEHFVNVRIDAFPVISTSNIRVHRKANHVSKRNRN